MLNPLHGNTTLKIVDGRGANPTAAIHAAADDLRNFIIILNSELELDKLWRALGTTEFVPERLRRWGILAMAEVLNEADYTRLLGLYRDNAIYLVEQLSLQRNVPPRTKRFMLYCEMRGIISDHDTVEEAGLGLLEYLDVFKRARMLPLAGIYEFDGRKWVRVKKLSSN